MSFLDLFITFYVSFVLPAFSIFVVGLLVLATFGKTLGIRKKYVQILLRVFEFGRERIEKAGRRRVVQEEDEEEEEEKVDGKQPQQQQEQQEQQEQQPKQMNNLVVQNGRTDKARKISVINRGGVILTPDPTKEPSNGTNNGKKEFRLSDPLDLIKAGVEAIIEDQVTQAFDAEELPSWNLLTRTNKNYHYISMRLTILWGIGCLVRYFILLPTRIIITFLGVGWLCLCTAVIGYIPNGRFKRWLYWHVSLMCFRILSRAFSAIVTYHNRENRAKCGGMCVANHTSPIDVVILASDNCYALVGQRHGGFLGLLQRALARATSHIWFERFEARDRETVARRLREHVEDLEKLPILIFPEGTCINNTSVMMFKKGSFEVGGTIYPVAIKYDPKFGDPFWNSSKHGYLQYLFLMMSSWAIVCDVWYLPPMTRREGESAVAFANRVKGVIARQGGLVDLVWDGQLKRMPVKKEWKEKQQEHFSKMLKVE